MILEKGNMFDVWGKTGLFLFTSNHVVRRDGKAVMGRGCARQVRDRAVGIDQEFGSILTANPYGLPPCGRLGTYDGQLVGYFMTKYHWAADSSLELIGKSTEQLKVLAMDMDRADLFYPGIANGNLRKEDVLPIIEALPDNVHIWEYWT